MNGLISLNGEFSSPDKASIPIMDRGFMLGDQIFEVFVGFREQLLDVKEHLTRLRNSAEDFELPIPWSDDELEFELKEIIRQTNFQKSYIKLVVTRGSGSGIIPQEGLKPTKIIYAFPAIQLSNQLYSSGISIKHRKLPYTERGEHPKTGNYLRSVIAAKKAKREGFDDVLWSNSEDEVTEATTANIFFIGRKGDLIEIITPPTHSGILKGITRGTVKKLLVNAKIRVDEEIIYKDEMPRFDEAFLCSTVKGLIPINRIDNHKLHTCRDKSVFRLIERLYDTWVETQLGHRVNWNTGKNL